MIYPQTMLTVADNTGAKKVMCIRVLGGNKKYAEIGETIIAVVKEAIPNMPVKRSDVIRAIVVRTKKTIRRQDGMYIRFDDNAAVIQEAPEFLVLLPVKFVRKIFQKLFL